MTSTKQGSPVLPKRAEDLIKEWKKLYDNFDDSSPPDKKESKEFKEFREKQAFLMRISRANSWLRRAQQMETNVKATDKELDTQILFLWIGFNALYGRDPRKNLGSKKEIEKYFKNLLKCPGEPKDSIYKIINGVLKENIDSLRKNIFVSRNFWNREMGINRERDIRFPGWKTNVTQEILCCVFQRLYVLRNQLMHGASTSGKTRNKDQLIDGAEIMHYLLPIFIEFMLRSPENKWKEWGEIWYPKALGVGIEDELYTSSNAPKNYRIES